MIATFEVRDTEVEPDVPVEVRLIEPARPTKTSTGRCAAGATLPALRSISPSSHCPTASLETFAVTVSVWLFPGTSVKLAGKTVRPIAFGLTTETRQLAVVASELVTVRVHVHVASQPELAMLASFSVVGSPPADGSAAV